MFHFRLRRRVRPVVNDLSLFLTWPSIAASIASSIAIVFVTLAAPSVMFYRTVFTGPGPTAGGALVRRRPFRSSSSPSSWRTFVHRWKRVNQGRYGTVFLLSISIAIEFFGCELARNGGAPLASSVSEAVPASLRSGQMLSFYDPNQAETRLSSSSTGDALRLLSRPVFNEAKPSPWAIPESVYFVYRSGQAGSGGFGRQPLATAFVLSVPDHQQRELVRLLVTARHVVDPRWARCAETNPSSIDLRLNRRSGGVGYETVSLQFQGHRRFFTPSDPAADIAVMLLDQSLMPNIEEYKFIDVPFRMLPTEAEIRQVRTRQPVITARAAPRPSSDSGNYPVFDGGVLAKMSNEAVNVQCGAAPELHPQNKSLHLWMINAGAPEGVSGAPVYTAIARGGGAGKTPVLLGVQSVAWPDQGVAGITPSGVLGELVQTALRGNRNQLDFYKGPALISKETSLY